MIEFCRRNGLTWTPPPGDWDGDASARVILEWAAGPGDERAIAALAEWIRQGTAPSRRCRFSDHEALGRASGRVVAPVKSPRTVRKRTQNAAKRRRLLSNTIPAQRVFPGISAVQYDPLSRSCSQRVMGSNPVNSTERETLATEGVSSRLGCFA
jgi:hypothetical protein